MNGSRDAKAPSLGQLLNPLRKNDARTSDRIIGDYDLTKRYANSDIRSDIVGQGFVLRPILELKGECRDHRVRGTLELSDKSVTAKFVDRSIVAGDHFGKSTKCILNPIVCDALVLVH